MEPYEEPSGVGIYILDASDDVINAADAIKKFLELHGLQSVQPATRTKGPHITIDHKDSATNAAK